MGTRDDENVFVHELISSKAVLFVRSVRVIADAAERKQKMKVFYKSMRIVLPPLQNSKCKGLAGRTSEMVKWKCVPVLVSYCCNIPQGMRWLPPVRDIAVMKPYVKRMMNENDIINDKYPVESH